MLNDAAKIEFYKHSLAETKMLFELVQQTLDGEEPDDFALSFGIVQEVWELKMRGMKAEYQNYLLKEQKKDLEAELAALKREKQLQETTSDKLVEAMKGAIWDSGLSPVEDVIIR